MAVLQELHGEIPAIPLKTSTRPVQMAQVRKDDGNSSWCRYRHVHGACSALLNWCWSRSRLK